MSRPSKYTEDLGNKICSKIAEGFSVRSICSDESMPCKATVFNWLLNEECRRFLDQYTLARRIQAETLSDELFDIADDGSNDWMIRNGRDDDELYQLNGEHLQRSRLRIDTRKWYLSKVLPKVYGDSPIDNTDNNQPITINLVNPHADSAD